MIATIATWLIARNPAMTLGAARRLAKIGLAVAVVLAIAGGAALWLHFHDAGVIERHETRAKLQDALHLDPPGHWDEPLACHSRRVRSYEDRDDRQVADCPDSVDDARRFPVRS